MRPPGVAFAPASPGKDARCDRLHQVMIVWQAAARLGLLPANVLPAPSDVLDAAWRLGASGELLANIAVSSGNSRGGYSGGGGWSGGGGGGGWSGGGGSSGGGGASGSW